MARRGSGRCHCLFVRAVAGFAALAGFAVLASGAGAEHALAGASQIAWQARLSEVEGAMSRSDLKGAQMLWREAYAAALRSRHWEGMVAVADVYRRLGALGNFLPAATGKARKIYIAALFRARQEASVDGVLSVAEAFADLGDQEVVSQCIDIARAVAEKGRDAGSEERVRVFAQRWGARLLEAETQDRIRRTGR